MKTKHQIRDAVRKRIATLSDDVRVEESRRVCARLCQRRELTAAASIGIYLALPDELSLAPLVAWARSEGKRLAAPVFRASEWHFHELSDDRNTQPGRFGIEEPMDGDVVPVTGLDVIVVPVRAVTRDGARLGRGKGIYDRLLSGFHGVTVGVAFGVQKEEEILTEAHDVILDAVEFGS